MSASVSAAAIAEPIPNLIPGPSHSPNDRGPCLDIQDASKYPFVRCQGRMIATMDYKQNEGYIVRWTCSGCGKVVIP